MASYTKEDLQKLGLTEIEPGVYQKITTPVVKSKPELKKSEIKHKSIINIMALVAESKGIFIPGNVPSSKNSKDIWYKPIGADSKSVVRCYRGNQRVVPFITDSKRVKEYREKVEYHFKMYHQQFIELTKGKPFPLNIGFQFVRERDNGWDFNNIGQVVQDMMKEYGWIPDDNHKYLVPVYKQPLLDKKLPGVIITVL